MIDYPNLIPECNVDTAFVEMLGYKKPNHAPSITIVSSILENKMTKRTAIGFVDNDKKQPHYFRNFKVIDTTANARLLKHSERNHYLVMVDPDMDTFIYKLCQELNINLAHYGFPRDFKAFVSFTKKEAIKNDVNFKNLLNTIKQKKPASIIAIQYWVSKYYQ